MRLPAICLVFLGIFGHSLMSAQQIIAQPVKGINISILPAGTAAFDLAIDQLGPTAQTRVKELGGASTYVTALQNNTGETIESVTIVYDVSEPKRVVRRACVLEHLSWSPGGVILVNPCRLSLSNEGMAGNGFQRDAAFFANKPISATIDNVVFADGGFVGPDTMNQFDRLIARDVAARAFFESVMGQRSQPSGSLQTWLATKAQQQVAPGNIETTDLAGLKERGLARSANLLLSKTGPEAVFTWAAKNLKALSQQPTLHKR